MLAFLLTPGWAAAPIALILFGSVSFFSPFAALLSLLGALPLHFLFRKPVGPVDLSLVEVMLPAVIVGLLGAAYWRALVEKPGASVRGLRPLLRSPYAPPFLLLVVLASASVVLLMPRTDEGFRVGLRQYSLIVEPIVVYILVRTTLANGRLRLWVALDVLLLGAAVVAGYGLIETIWYTVSPPPNVGGYHRVQSMFNHPNTLGLYLSRMIPLFGTLGLILPGGRRRRVYIGVTLVLGVIALLSGSRGAWMALAAAALVVAVLTGRFRWLLPAGGLGLLGLGGLILSGQNRLMNVFQPGRGSGDTRRRLWRAAADEIQNSPILGAGLGDVRWMRRYIPARRLQGTELVDAHNLFLDFWSKLGFIGLALMLWLLARYYQLSWRVYRRSDPTYRAIGVALIATMTAAFVHGMIDAFYFGLQLAMLFWFLLGVAELLNSQPTDEPSSVEKVENAPPAAASTG